jgi:N-methylhydantoinase A
MLSVDSESGGAARSADASPLRILARRRDELEERGRKELQAEGFELKGLTVQVFLDMRYAAQSYELAVPAESVAPAEFLPAFHTAHQTRFGHSDLSRAVEVITLRGRLTLPGIDTENRKEETETRKAKRSAATHQSEVWFEGKPLATSIYERDDLLPGFRFAGPAVVAQMDSTTALPPGWRCEVDEMNNLRLATV